MNTLLYQAMSEEQFSVLLAKLKEDIVLREKLQGTADLDTALAIAKEAGFDVSKADWLKYQAIKTLALSDDELESVAGAAWERWRNSYKPYYFGWGYSAPALQC